MISSSGVDRTMQRHFLCKNTPLPTSVLFLPPTVEVSTKQKRHSVRTTLIVSYVSSLTLKVKALNEKPERQYDDHHRRCFQGSRMIFKKVYTEIIHD